MKILVVAALGGALLLPGCASFRPPTADAIKAFIAQVNAVTRAGCQFVADNDVIVQIINNGVLTGVYAVADAICGAILASQQQQAQSGARRVALPRVGSVVITGTFTR